MNDSDKSREALLEELAALRRENRELKQAARKTAEKKILIVDDNDDTRELVMEMVEDLGFSAVSAATSAQALSIFATDPARITLIISDIVMPDGDGHQLMKKIAGMSGQAKMIFMSGYAEDEIVHDAVYQVQDAKAAFIKKPFTTAELGTLINAHIS